MTDQTVHAFHILIKHAGSRNPISRRTGQQITITPQDAMTELEDIKASILLTAANAEVYRNTFMEKAVERSDCSSFRKYGDLGNFGRGAMQLPFEEASFALKVGEMTSDIVETESGHHLIYRFA